MTSFTDTKGEVWDLELNLAAVKVLKSRLKIDLDNLVSSDPGGNSMLEQLASDSILLFNAIYCLCEKQVLERNLTEEDFAARFSGDTIEAATEALLDEIVNFSRPAKRKILIQLRRISKEIAEKAGRELDQIMADPNFSATVEAEIEKQLPKLPPTAPGSSD